MGIIQEGFNQFLTMAAAGASVAKHGIEENRKATEGLKAEKKDLESKVEASNIEIEGIDKSINDVTTNSVLNKSAYFMESENLAKIRKERPRTAWGKQDKNLRMEASKKALQDYATEIGRLKEQKEGFLARRNVLEQRRSELENDIAGVQGKLDFQKEKFKKGVFAEGGKK